MDSNIAARFNDGVVYVSGTGVLSAPVGTQMTCAVACARAHCSELYLYDFRPMVSRIPGQRLSAPADCGGGRHSAHRAHCHLGQGNRRDIQFVEDVAVNRGVVLQIFTDEAAALSPAIAADPSEPNKNHHTDPAHRR